MAAKSEPDTAWTEQQGLWLVFTGTAGGTLFAVRGVVLHS